MKKRKRIITSKIKKGSLIPYALRGIKKESFNVIRKELQDVLKNRSGIYALYKGDKLVRVGLGTNIYWRVKGHTKGKFDWDTASLFIIKNIRHLRDVETAVVGIAKPKYNDIRGRVGDEYYLERILKKKVNEKKRRLRTATRKKDREIRKLERDIDKIKEVIRK